MVSIVKIGMGLVLAGLVGVLAGQPVAPQPRRSNAQEPSVQKGVSFASWWSGQYSSIEADRSLAELAETGATWISLIVTGYQATHTATTIDRSSERTPTDADLVHTIEQAHALGLQVMLKPHVDLPNEWESEYWRGDIGTEFSTEAEWEAWFASYRAFLEHYAALAQAHGVEQFCVGTELLGTTHREDDWRQVVAGVRAVYDGPLVYAALHSGEEVSITWWDAVDYIGVDAYYPLTGDVDHHPTIEELQQAWQVPKAILANLAATYGKPVILTEIGYRSHHGCSNHPWDSWIVSPLDVQEQAYAYEAAFRELFGQPWLAGTFWWAWYHDPFQSGPCDPSFTPHLKPAENVLRAGYGAAPRQPQPALAADYDQTLDISLDGLTAGWQDWSWDGQVNVRAETRTFAGTRAIEAELLPWGALSLWSEEAFSTDRYTWLEFYVLGASPEPPNLATMVDTVDGTRLYAVPVNDCRHIEEGPISDVEWRRVRIPLRDLNPEGLPLSRLTIQNRGGESVLFWIDEVRLVAAQEVARVFLPVVTKQVH